MRRLQNRRSSAARLALILTLALGALPGCGLAASRRLPFDPSVKTVYVPIFKSQTFRRDLNLQLNELLCKEIERRTPYKVVGTQEGADTIIAGVVAYDMKNTVVENPSNMPRQQNMTINLQVTWMRNPPSDDDRRRTPTIIAETVNFSPEIGESASTAIYAVNQRLATQIVDMMELPWFGGPASGID